MKLLINFAILLLLAAQCKSQQLGTRINANAVTIFNNSSRDISFLLGERGKKMKVYEIIARDNWVSPTYSTGPVIDLRTGKVHKKYNLKLASSYMIFWDAPKKVWNVKKIKPR